MPCLNLPNDMQIFGKLMSQPFEKTSLKWIFIAFEFMLSADVTYLKCISIMPQIDNQYFC